MSRMKDYLAIIHGGGDEAVEIAQQLMGLSDFTVQDEPRWIPLGEALPDEGVDVLWFSLCKDMKVGRRYGEEIDAYAEDGFEYMSNFSHWMPLPKPPKCAIH